MMASKDGDPTGILFGPLHQGRVKARTMAKHLFRMLLAIGVRNVDIDKVVVDPEAGFALAQLRSREAEDFIVRACKDVRDLLNFYDLRLLTPSPKQFKAIRRYSNRFAQQVHRTFPALRTEEEGTSEEAGGSNKKYQVPKSRPRPKSRSAEKIVDEDGKDEVKNDVTPDESAEPPTPPGLEITPDESTEPPTPPGLEIEVEAIPIPNVPDPVSSSSSSCSSPASQHEFEQLEEEPTLPVLIHASTSVSESHDHAHMTLPVVVKVDVKTSTPHVSPCFCPETVFFHKKQFVGSENRHVEFKRGGNVSDLRQFRSLVGKYMCAFLNTEGGTIYFGVTDDGRVLGIVACQKTEDTIRLTIDNAVTMIKPVVDPAAYSVNFAKVMADDGTIAEDLKVLEICVKPREPPRLRFNFSDVVYVRRDGSLRTIT